MPAKVVWYDPDHIILYTVSDPLTLNDLEDGAAQVWNLASGVRDMVDMVFDYRNLTDFPRGIMPIVREGNFRLPILERIALVGDQPLVEMMMTTLTQNTFRPHPTVHDTVPEAAEFLKRMAEEDQHLG